MESASEGMELYLRPNDVVNITWMPEELIPSHLIANSNETKVNIQLFQQLDRAETLTVPRWEEIPNTQVVNLDNTGSAVFKVPAVMDLKDCLRQKQLCPIAFRVSAVVGSMVTVPNANVGPVGLPTGPRTEVGIWSGVGYLRSHTATMMSLGVACQEWNTLTENNIPTSIQNEVPVCPPTEQKARVDNRFREEELNSAFGTFDTGYAQSAMKLYYPEARVCYIEIVMNRLYVVLYFKYIGPLHGTLNVRVAPMSMLQ